MRIATPNEDNLIFLGKEGENEAVQVVIDVSEILTAFGGGGSFVLTNMRSEDTLGYPVEVLMDGSSVIWTVQNADLAYAGEGKLEVTYYLGSIVAKTVTYQTYVCPSVTGGAEPPEPWKTVIDQILQARDEAVASASAASDSEYNASQSASDASLSAETAKDEADRAEELADQIEHSIDDIEALIPPQASPENQLADKSFVNSSVATNTANYISNNGEPFTSVAQLEAYSGTVTNNDYAFVTGTDAAGNTYYDRYKATVSGGVVTWAKEYRLNNSSFTAVQWAAIESGITASLVASYSAHVADKNNPHEVTAAQLGLGNVDNTPDSQKPVSQAQAAALALKADKVADAIAGNLAALDENGNLTDSGVKASDLQLKYSAQTVTLLAASWSNGSQTVAAPGVTATNLVEVAPAAKADADAYLDGEVWCSVQGEGELAFVCGATAPASDITVNVVVWDDRSAPIVPEEVRDRLEFWSDSPFSLAIFSNTPGWNGTMEYSADGRTWATWTGASAISSGTVGGRSYLALRGTGNTKVSGAEASRWVFSGSDPVDAIGDLDALLDYAAFAAGNEPTRIADTFSFLFEFNTLIRTAPTCNARVVADRGLYCTFRGSPLQVAPPRLPAASVGRAGYSSMFENCTALIKAPKTIAARALTNNACTSMFSGCSSLKRPPQILALTLSDYALASMFGGCSNLEALPELIATSFADYACQRMFDGCAKIKMSTTMSAEYQTTYRIPSQGTATAGQFYPFFAMFNGTGGSFKGTPTVNTTYYTANEIISAE